MAKRKKRINPEKPLQELAKCMKKLSEDQGPVARRNARAAVFAELRRLKGWTDRTYPSKRKRKKAAKKSKKTKKPKKARKIPEGYEIMSGMISPLFAAAGIPVKMRRNENGHRQSMVPKWALELVRAHATVHTLKRAKRDINYRKEKLMEKRWKEREA